MPFSTGGHLRHVRAWYCYAFAAEVFSACAIAIFLPITLEQMARDVGYLSPDLTVPCAEATDLAERVCKARILGVWIDTASFSMYIKSIAVAIQALCIVTIGPLADSTYWRKRLLLLFAYTGATSSSLFLFFPAKPHGYVPVLAACLTILGNATYATSIVCNNAFLPELAREDEDVQLAYKAAQGQPEDLGNLGRRSVDEEAQSLLPPALVPAVTAISAQDLASTPEIDDSARAKYEALLSLTTSRLSSTGTALGFLSGVGVLALLMIPVLLLHGSTKALCLAIALSGVWWAVFTVPPALGLPAGHHDGKDLGNASSWMGKGWRRVGNMVRPKEIRSLPNLFTLLLAWVFLSDGFHTTTYTAILYASSTLRMSPAKIIIIGILVQLAAVFSSILSPRLQARLGYTNLKYLIMIVLLSLIIPIYACVGLILPFGGLRTEGEMYVAATWFGILYGPFNSYSRAVYAELIPPGHESSFFSLFSLTDKSSSFIGPMVVGVIADLTGNIRLGFVFLLILLAVPIPVLLGVKVKEGGEEARRWTSSRGKDGERVGLLRSNAE